MCGFQALLLPLLLQQAALCLTLLAVDRYYCLIHPGTYSSISTKMTSLSLVLGSWCLSIAFYSSLFLPSSANYFFFNTISGACEVFPSSHARLTFAACFLYFPTTMIMMYCYGTAFHTDSGTLHRFIGATVTAPQLVAGTSVNLNRMVMSERGYQHRISRVMAVLSLSFVILITPWTLRQIIAACTAYKMPLWVDYSVWLVSETGGLLMLLVYWLLSPALRRATQHTLHNRVCCGNVLLEKWDEPPLVAPSKSLHLNDLNKPNARGINSASRSLTTTPYHQVNGKAPSFRRGSQEDFGFLDNEAAGEKFWGEILERAVSSTSLHNVQRLNKPSDANHYAVTSFCEVPPQFRLKCNLHPTGIRPV